MPVPGISFCHMAHVAREKRGRKGSRRQKEHWDAAVSIARHKNVGCCQCVLAGFEQDLQELEMEALEVSGCKL